MANLSEPDTLKFLLSSFPVSRQLRQQIGQRAVELVKRIREDSDPGMMELFLGEYGLSSDEGVALMCLAEALLRVPDGDTMDALIEDKIAPSAWGHHLGRSHSSLVNASTWALFVTGKVLNEDQSGPISSILNGVIKRLGEPVIREAVRRVMMEMGRQFVLGETIEAAIKRAAEKEWEGFTYSYDMLGEAAKTEADAKRYHIAYGDAISELAKHANSSDIRTNPGISIKLSALHPRYESLKEERVMAELVPRALSLAILAKSAGIGFNIDAEEAGRLEISLNIIEAILGDPALAHWNGFGIVVQAYNRSASRVIERLYALAVRLDRRIMVRLVKGAYWDTEIKLAQVEGHADFPVFTQKASTDVSYICCARQLLGMSDRIYAQFATHNAHSVAAILEMAQDKTAYEFQRLHGMGEALHDTVLRRQGTRCRIYAPVGSHKDLLAYLVRRLLENGANSSFVNQIVDEDVPPEIVAADPFEQVEGFFETPHNPLIKSPGHLYSPARTNSKGWDLSDLKILQELENGIAAFDGKEWKTSGGTGEQIRVINPANGEFVGEVQFCTREDAVAAATEVTTWYGSTAPQRAEILRVAADLYEENAHEIFALLIREAGKTLLDCVGELREAVDFLRYYAAQVESQAESEDGKPLGIFTCISPWNFPLAIFSGQIAAALAMGNGVLAKPAESTGLIAGLAVSLLHKAGVPESALKLLPGSGADIGQTLTGAPNVGGVCFTGSTSTAHLINQTMAKHLSPHAPLIAETGGLNAMIVDSTALPEQAVRDVVASAFQSAGQRCSALRLLYLQEDVADNFLNMLCGAVDELEVGDPRKFSTDIGPIIDANAAQPIQAYIDRAMSEERLIKTGAAPDTGTFIAPTIIRVNGIEDLESEIFGPVLHVATFAGDALDSVVNAVNSKGYGLTFGLHSRIDDRVQHITEQLKVGNIYINRNQIGAVVGSQPFGGEGLSGTGPKAGGPCYLDRFTAFDVCDAKPMDGKNVSAATIVAAFEALPARSGKRSMECQLPGPTGESNVYYHVPKGNVLCLGPTAELAMKQLEQARKVGCNALAIAPGLSNTAHWIDAGVAPETLTELTELDAVVCWADNPTEFRNALACRTGKLVPLYTQLDFEKWLTVERHICIDTTAAGGNAQLLGEQ